jgi:DNA-directed DNA polymerase III PolC
MVEKLKDFLVPERAAKVDADFLDFEERTLTTQDRELLLNLLSAGALGTIKLSNPHNSLLLYVLGLSDEFDSQRARSDTIGGASPDIDVDYSSAERKRVLAWVVDHWGREKVANIATCNLLGPKSVSRKYFSVTEAPEGLLQRLAPLIPDTEYGKQATYSDLLEAQPGLPSDPVYRDYCVVASTLQDVIQAVGVHASGIAIAPEALIDRVPLFKTTDYEVVTQFDKEELEELGILKYDFLAIDTLSILSEALRLIHLRRGEEIDLYSLPQDDPTTFALLNKGYLAGIFQMEASNTAKQLISQIQPSSIDEISIVTALNRPGPIEAGFHKQYVTNRDSGTPPSGMPPVVQKALSSTAYVMVYQETVMNLFHEVAGFTLKEADDIRRAMGKKKKEVMELYQERFISGAQAVSGLEREYAQTLWDEILGYSNYAFNASHSYAYSYLTYLAAYLKAHYPPEFFCALMSVRSQVMQPEKWTQRAPQYIREARELGIEVEPPSANRSEVGFVLSEKKLYFGFNAIKGIGAGAAKSIVSARGRHPFKDIFDFLQRISTQKVNTAAFQALTQAGVFDCLGYDRAELLDSTQTLYDYVASIPEQEEREREIVARNAENIAKQLLIEERDKLTKTLRALEKRERGVSGSVEPMELLATRARLEELLSMDLRRRPSLKQKAALERPVLKRGGTVRLTLPMLQEQARRVGCNVGVHPSELLGLPHVAIDALVSYDVVTICGIVTWLKVIKTKAGKEMAFLGVEDQTGAADVTLFPSLWMKAKGLGISVGALVSVRGKVEDEVSGKVLASSLNLHKESSDALD